MNRRIVRASEARRAAAPPAFVLIEMLIAIGLFTVFSLVAFRLVSSTLRIANEVNRADIAHRSFDAALAGLRRDVWGAAKVEVRGPGAVTIDLAPGAGSATWSVAADGSLVRTLAPDGADPERQGWPDAGGGVTFAADPAGIVLDVQRHGHDNGTYRLVSQVLLASERK
jgi:type II secretory pathway pseudopilin PulG